MLTDMGAANPKFSKSGRKPKKTKHCTIPKNLWQVKRKVKRALSKGIDLIRMIVVNKITKMRVCSMDIKTKFGGKFSFLTSVEKKGMKDRDKDAKSKGWNLGNF